MANDSAVPSEKASHIIQTGFRAYSHDDFRKTASWDHLRNILNGNGGCYGLYGPRGSGKSWLMLNAIYHAQENGGLGLWFPSPSEYDASAFLSSLSDNLANEIERRFARNNTLYNLLIWLRRLLIAIAAVPVSLAIIIYIFRSISGSNDTNFFSVLPFWLWTTAVAAAYILIPIIALQFVRDNRPQGRLVKDATLLRERIRFTASLRLGAEAGVQGGGKSISASVKRSQEKSLAERPTTIASLVFEFRRLVSSIASLMNGPVIIGIDELDKMQDPRGARALLRDIKGIFEVTGVYFLVSVSEEAAAALQLGTIQPGGRNEFNSSFYTVIELPPLGVQETEALLARRGYTVSSRQASALCLISAGNQRELIRIADETLQKESEHHVVPVEDIVISAMKGESYALLREIVRNPTAYEESTGSAAASVQTAHAEIEAESTPGGQEKLNELDANAKAGAWQALSRESFQSKDGFINLGSSAILDYWSPSWFGDGWKNVSESWKRLLIRLFVMSRLIGQENNEPSEPNPMLEESAIKDLLEVMIMAGQDAGVARLMLESRFGAELSGKYERGKKSL